MRDVINNDELLAAGVAGRLLGVSAERLRQLANAGTILPVRRPSGRRYYLSSEIEALRVKRAAELHMRKARG